MDEPSGKPRQSWFDRLRSKIKDEPETPDELLETLHTAYDRNLLDENTLKMVEGVLAFSEMEVRDVMVSRSQMDVIRSNESLERIIDIVTETTHSRFPVIGEDKDDVLGILHSKDLLHFFARPDRFNLKEILRPAQFVPESKSLSDLLRECQSNRTHMIMIVDEYGGTSGLITIEDLIEEITGDIEDEFDLDDSAANIVELSEGRYRVKATTTIEDINEFFSTRFSDEEADTIGGLVISEVGYLPEKGEKITLENMEISVVRVDPRRLHTLIIVRNKPNV